MINAASLAPSLPLALALPQPVPLPLPCGSLPPPLPLLLPALTKSLTTFLLVDVIACEHTHVSAPLSLSLCHCSALCPTLSLSVARTQALYFALFI